MEQMLLIFKCYYAAKVGSLAQLTQSLQPSLYAMI